ncbi:sulfatase-like hydrolase/transferase [Paraglaciecola chathamensis]|uniref:sulfatase-like hydrolase/transferase n=1 Tax=Paraglaciecola chathamensis TaxID=368405 RepID=UPI0027089571|nr:sulfatase-like hydrolase/transferase [Paraglaciecola chathamensis]MDO6840181.1 sulfatase-like hydrolase/transferase [Paraglaciecola chathamensis]
MKILRLVEHSFIILGAVTLLACTTSVSVAKAPTKGVTKKPNVLILMFDDMRFDTFSYRGGPVNTPNIDELASQSTRFDYAMSTTGLCSPSRAAFFTGRWGHKTGLDDNVELYHSRVESLSLNEGGLIKRAADSGYMVGYVGKWHIGAKGPRLRGAEFVTGKSETVPRKLKPRVPRDRQQGIDHYHAGGLDGNNEKHQYYQTLDGTYEDTHAAEKVRDGQQLLRAAAKDARPFFGVISFNQPHPAYRVPEPYASMFDPKKIKLPGNFNAKRVNKPMAQDGIWWPWHDVDHMSEADWRKSRAYYYGAMAMVDHAVGEIINTAKEVGMYDDLHIVFIGDQGSMIGEHGLYDKGPYAYDELMRIPLLIKDPSVSPRIVNRHVSMIDVAPTLAQWMSLPNDGDVDGHSLVPLMEKGDSAISDEQDFSLYAYEWYNGAWFGVRAIRDKNFKFVWYPSDDTDELYNLKEDPLEMTNLAKDPNYRKVALRMANRLEEELIRIKDPSFEKLNFQKQAYMELN